MTPEQRAEAIVTSPEGLDAISHGDTFKLEAMIAAAIREAVAEEREACATVCNTLAESFQHVEKGDYFCLELPHPDGKVKINAFDLTTVKKSLEAIAEMIRKRGQS